MKWNMFKRNKDSSTPIERLDLFKSKMRPYIGTKIINATECTFKEYQDAMGILADDKTIDQDGYIVKHKDDYISWSSRKAFTDAYRPIDGFSFGIAIENAKKGHKIARKGWNGKNMYVVYRKGYPDGVQANPDATKALDLPDGSIVKIRPYLQMMCADGSLQMWMASQSDILEEDWYLVK